MEYKSDAGYVGRLKKGSRLVVENPQGEKIIEVRDIWFNDAIYMRKFVDDMPKLLRAVESLRRDR